jgi:hypothetical protein
MERRMNQTTETVEYTVHVRDAVGDAGYEVAA